MGILPEVKSVPSTDVNKETYLIYGQSGIGKTTFCARLEEVLFLDTEKGSTLQNAYRLPIPDWETFVRAVDELALKKHKFKNVVIDTVGRLVLMCTRYCCDKFNIQHPSDMEFGKAYDIIKKQFDGPIHKLQHQGLGVWFVAHTTSRLIKAPIGGDFEFFEPDLPAFLKRSVLALCDFVFYCTIETKIEKVGTESKVVHVRQMRTKPTKSYLAKDRIVNSPLPDPLPLDTKEAMETIQKHLKINSETLTNG